MALAFYDVWAIDGARTRDNQSHNLGLYLLSYDRREVQIYRDIAEPRIAPILRGLHSHPGCIVTRDYLKAARY